LSPSLLWLGLFSHRVHCLVRVAKWPIVSITFSLTLCITLVMFVLAICACIFGSKGAWKRGIKDLHKDGLHGFSISGHRRPDDDDTRILVPKIFKLFRTWLLQTVYRRIEYVLKPDIQVLSLLTNVSRGVESVKFAMARKHHSHYSCVYSDASVSPTISGCCQ